MGIAASARPMPAVIALRRIRIPKASWSQVASTMRAKNPMTTDGIPARSSTAGLITSRTPWGANSEVKMAAPTAIGRAIRSATTVTFKVRISSGRREYFGTVETGCHEKPPPSWGATIFPTVTSLWISAEVSSGIASFATKKKMRMTAPITTNPLDRMKSSISISIRRGFPARRRGSGFGKSAPGLHLGRVDRLELGQGDFLKLAALVDEDGQPVHRHREFHRILAVLV